ncbi:MULTISPECIES: spore coat protein GerQ [Terribacillus]|jgi:spore germination protein Q|uniref:Spore coat protein GerQ n=1 Tax=Terribacillus saccharophilus TaxID=361277 RepID=A0ABX4GY26_9BACI|nr:MULTISPECIES: spore coat protein GerQ [Terribacillus]PAD35150.1 spore coat protein GerQ [Terribacillus saccharophilus]PAD95899.1 spore coat protein GerQ [Terribacillus saccharophilus]PAD99777.1 spore coat protein GerQ [Terribacillus saccharophilus]
MKMSKNPNQENQSPGTPQYQEQSQAYTYPQVPNYSYPTRQQNQPFFPQQQQQQQQQVPSQVQGGGPAGPGLPVEQSYIENILRLNRNKLATVYMTFENNDRWNAKIFKGVIEAAGRDHLILRDPENNRRYLLLMVYLDYVTFDEPLNYSYPFGNPGGTATYPPR